MSARPGNDPLHHLLGANEVSDATPIVETFDDSKAINIDADVAASDNEPARSAKQMRDQPPVSTLAMRKGRQRLTGDDDTDLLELSSAIDRAKAFAEGWDTPYQIEIFRVALDRLLQSSRATAVGFSTAFPTHAQGARVQGDAMAGYGANDGSHGTVVDGIRPIPGVLGPVDKLARALNTDVDAVERAVHIDDNGKIAILGRLEGRAKKELQTRYSLVYLYVKEMALGSRMVDIDELRILCVDQGCYDQGNFTGNYKKDVIAGLIREQGEKGARVRRYMLSQKGVAVAADLLREMVNQ